MKILAMVNKENGELKIERSAGMRDLLEYHPKCDTCERHKGIHGQESAINVFCLWWNKPVSKTGYCSNHTQTEGVKL